MLCEAEKLAEITNGVSKQCRRPTRCNNNDLLIIPISSTFFGQFFAHHQER
jgi:hypothetical protein